MGKTMIGLIGAALLWPLGGLAQGAPPAWALDAPATEALLRSLALGGMQTATEMLARSIMLSRQQALDEGTAPIPVLIRQRLEGHVPPEDLDAVRWRVGGGDETSLQWNAIVNGPATAITLLDVVVFEDEGDALANAELWAHELRHVGQYREWGLRGFSQRYITDHQWVEEDAMAFAARWRDGRSLRPRPRPWP